LGKASETRRGCEAPPRRAAVLAFGMNFVWSREARPANNR
jgi:hypothetical protein